MNRNLALDFALAVTADDRALYIGPDNRGDGWAGVAEAVASGRAFCVSPRPDLIVGDFDDEKGGMAAAIHVRDVTDHHDGVRAVVVRSGPSEGRAHVYVVGVTDPYQRETIEETIRGLGGDLRKGNKRIRPPLSPHRSGSGVAYLVYPKESEEALAVLQGRSLPPETPGKAPGRDVEARIAEYLAPGWEGNRSDALMTVANVCANGGWTYDQFRDRCRCGTGAATKLEDPRRRDREREYERLWKKATKLPPEVEAWIGIVGRIRFGPRQWGLRETALAIGRIAARTGKSELSISVSEITEKRIVCRATASNHLRDLAKMGLIERVKQGRGPEANVYRLVGDKLEHSPHPVESPVGCGSMFISVPPQEALEDIQVALRRKHACQAVLIHLRTHGAMTLAQIAETLGMKRETVKKNAQRLRDLRMVEYRAGRLWPVNSESVVAEAARLTGNVGAADRIRRDNLRHRKGWIAYLDRGRPDSDLQRERAKAMQRALNSPPPEPPRVMMA